MSQAIEQMIKMFDPQGVSIESLNIGRGKAILTRDQIIGAFAAAQHQHAVGYDLLMAKYRLDYRAEQRVREAINIWVHRRERPERAHTACQLALNIVLERNLPAQIAQIALLLRDYGSRPGVYRKAITEFFDQIRILENSRSQVETTTEEYKQLSLEIEQLQQQIKTERGIFRAWSESEAALTNICPRCRGTGIFLRPHPANCEECGGAGRIKASLEHVQKSMAMIGAKIKPDDWTANYASLVQECMNWLYVEESNAGFVISDKIGAEMDSPAY